MQRSGYLHLTCPSCGGRLVRRPRRPAAKLVNSPASPARLQSGPQGDPGQGRRPPSPWRNTCRQGAPLFARVSSHREAVRQWNHDGVDKTGLLGAVPVGERARRKVLRATLVGCRRHTMVWRTDRRSAPRCRRRADPLDLGIVPRRYGVGLAGVDGLEGAICQAHRERPRDGVTQVRELTLLRLDDRFDAVRPAPAGGEVEPPLWCSQPSSLTISTGSCRGCAPRRGRRGIAPEIE